MKAYSLHGISDLRYGEIERPSLRQGWCLVKVKAAGICSSDVPRVFTKGTYRFPTVPGHEFSGVVEKVFAEADSSWVGKRVGVFPLIPCSTCEQCQGAHYEMCERYDYVGSRRDGAFAELVAVPIWNLVELPDKVGFLEAAMLEPLSVALHAVKRADVKIGDDVGIFGTGMIGFAAAQWARLLGAENVTVVGRSAAKAKYADSLGLSYFSTNSDSELPLFDCVVEAVGTSSCIAEAIKATKPGGNLVLMGNPNENIVLSQDVYWRILRKQLNICGTWNSSYESGSPSDWTEALEAIANGSVSVAPFVTHLFPQEQLMEGLSLMKERSEPYCKVMTLWNEGD